MNRKMNTHWAKQISNCRQSLCFSLVVPRSLCSWTSTHIFLFLSNTTEDDHSWWKYFWLVSYCNQGSLQAQRQHHHYNEHRFTESIWLPEFSSLFQSPQHFGAQPRLITFAPWLPAVASLLMNGSQNGFFGFSETGANELIEAVALDSCFERCPILSSLLLSFPNLGPWGVYIHLLYRQN